MEEAINTTIPAVAEHEFPASSPNGLAGFWKRIPRPMKITGAVILAVILLAVTFPRKSKGTVAVSEPEEQSSTVDNIERQNPIKTVPFSTAAVAGSASGSPLAANSGPGGDAGYGQTMQPLPSGSSMTDRGSDEDGSASRTPSGNTDASGKAHESYALSQWMQHRLSGTYQGMIKHFKGVDPVGTMENDAYRKLLAGDKLDKVDPALRNLTPDSEQLTNKVNFSVPSGTRIRAVTQQEVSSDHPGYFTARITSPMELSGYNLLCQSRGNTRDRIPVTANKIIAPDGSRETQIPGEVQMKYAGLEGHVKSHALRRLIPPIAGAFVGAGAGYLYFKALGGNELNSEVGRINTADQVVGPPYQEGVSGVQNEIGRLGGDYPNTVIVPQGAQFELLVTEPFSIEL